jgi:hypothetical protein
MLNYLGLLICALATCILPSISYAQSAAGYLNRVEFVGNVGDLLQTALPWMQDKGMQSKAQKQIEADGSSALSRLTWSGERGVLYEFRVEQEPVTGVSRPLGNPIYRGYGETPLFSLASNMESAAIVSGPSDGFTLSEDQSFFIWMTIKDSNLSYGIIGQPFYGPMNKQARMSVLDKMLMKEVKTSRGNRVLTHSLEQLQKAANDEQSKMDAVKLKNEIDQQIKRLNDIEKNLAKEMERQASAQAFLNQIQGLQNVLSLVTVSNQIKEILDDVPLDKVNNAKNTGDIIKVTNEYIENKNGIVTRVKQEKTITINQQNKSIESVQDLLKKNGAPTDVIDGISPKIP